MKTNPFITLSTGMLAMLAVHARAIEAPADDSPPPPPVAGEETPQAAPAKEPSSVDEKPAKPYLGVASQPIPDILAEHLGIKTDEGIVVGSVMPDGPAAKAGIEVNDIIKRVGDKAIGSPLDLTQTVGGHKPGEKVRIDIIRKGKASGLDVTLGTRPDELAANDVPQLDNLNLEGVPKELADRVRDAIRGNIGRIEMQMDPENLIAPQVENEMRDARKRMEKAMEAMKDLKNKQGALGIVPKIEVQHGATIRMMDGKGSIELKSNNGGKEVTLRDKDNKVTWNGPWDTEQDKAAAPDDVRERVSRLNIDTDFKGGGIRLRGGMGLGMGGRLELEGGE